MHINTYSTTASLNYLFNFKCFPNLKNLSKIPTDPQNELYTNPHTGFIFQQESIFIIKWI